MAPVKWIFKRFSFIVWDLPRQNFIMDTVFTAVPFGGLSVCRVG